MILDMQNIRGFVNIPVINISWQQQFLTKIQAHNKEVEKQKMKQSQQQHNNNSQLQQCFLKVLMKKQQQFQRQIGDELFRDEKPLLRLKIYQNKLYQHYSNFVPVRDSCYQYKNQFQLEFPFACYANQRNYKGMQTQFENDIKNNLESVHKFRQVMNQKYNPPLSFTNKIKLYVKLLCHGTIILNKFPNQSALLHKLCQSQVYFAKDNLTNSNLSVSVQKNQKIKAQTVSQAMKSLYCPLCFIYDCPTHASGGDPVQSDFVSDRNRIQKELHLRNAIKMIDEQNRHDTIKIACEKQCYCNLDSLMKQNNNYMLILLNRVSHLSDLTKSLIQIGISLFSFNPCKIRKILSSADVSCMMVFKYLQTHMNIFGLIANKSYQNQQEMLRNQFTETPVTISKFIVEHKRRKNKQNTFKSKNKNSPSQDPAKESLINSICKHHYLSQESFDIQCQNCICTKRGFCTPTCLCSSQCSIMKIGCRCKQIKGSSCHTKSCPCYLNNVQCIPEICGKSCRQNDGCLNRQIQLRMKKHLKIGLSLIAGAGLGLFAFEDIEKDNLVTVYLGEKVDPFALQIREQLRKNDSFYNFEQKDIYIDSKFIGNKSRFINHGNKKQTNLTVKLMQSMGQIWTAFYASRDIEAHEQLYFNYDGDGQIAKHHSEKYPFIAAK